MKGGGKARKKDRKKGEKKNKKETEGDSLPVLSSFARVFSVPEPPPQAFPVTPRERPLRPSHLPPLLVKQGVNTRVKYH